MSLCLLIYQSNHRKQQWPSFFRDRCQLPLVASSLKIVLKGQLAPLDTWLYSGKGMSSANLLFWVDMAQQLGFKHGYVSQQQVTFACEGSACPYRHFLAPPWQMQQARWNCSLGCQLDHPGLYQTGFLKTQGDGKSLKNSN